MKQRLDYKQVAPGGFKVMLELEQYVRQSGIEHSLLELVKTRTSQINHCAWCLDMHTKEARARGETEQRLYLLTAWREAGCYSDRERAALAWTEAVTTIAQNAVSDELYADARRHFSEKELVNLTFAIIAINGWNRLNVPFLTTVGTYQPATQPAE
jgi:AhpD family alkylhydroperoxidase